MNISYDPAKCAANVERRGLSFERAADFDFSAAWVVEDLRKAYPERRFQAIGPLDGRLHVLVFAPEAGGIRVISFRKANSREVRRYEQQTKAP